MLDAQMSKSEMRKSSGRKTAADRETMSFIEGLAVSTPVPVTTTAVSTSIHYSNLWQLNPELTQEQQQRFLQQQGNSGIPYWSFKIKGQAKA